MSQKSKKQEAEQELTIEESFEYLDEVLEQLEDEELPLEDSFALYERGMKVLRSCSEKIDTVEKKVKLLNAEGGVEDFDV